mmetsp:Transcript_17454/g.42428  ORF Transcript_17454/g.42428 Transcript_17454/m.42428 type:complete len:506 (-) Transcript_17454:1123-2640(-)
MSSTLQHPTTDTAATDSSTATADEHNSQSVSAAMMIRRILDGNSRGGGDGGPVDDNDNVVVVQDQPTQQQQPPQQQQQGSGNDDNNTQQLVRSNQQKQQYELRLLSFFESYKYKPSVACLSPLLCARFGWESVDNDMLVCSGCKSALTVPLNLRLSLSETYIDTIRTKIVSDGHVPQTCPFKMSIETFRKYDDVSDDIGDRADGGINADVPSSSSLVPTYMTEVVPDDFLDLVDNPTPRQIIQSRAKELLMPLSRHQSTTTTTQKWTYPSLILPNEIQQIKSKAGSLLGLATEDEETTSDRGNGNASSADILALAVLGWKPLEVTSNVDLYPALEGTPPVVCLGCSVCFAFMELQLQNRKDGEGMEVDAMAEEGDGDSRRPTKRQQHRKSSSCDPVASHRYYCPFVTGFPKTVRSKTKPIWKTIFERLCQDETGNIDKFEGEANGAGNDAVVGPSTATTEKDEPDGGSAAASVDEMMNSISRIKKILYSGISHQSPSQSTVNTTE